MFPIALLKKAGIDLLKASTREVRTLVESLEKPTSKESGVSNQDMSFEEAVGVLEPKSKTIPSAGSSSKTKATDLLESQMLDESQQEDTQVVEDEASEKEDHFKINEISAVDEAEFERQLSANLEVVIVGPKSTFRSKVFAYTKGELVFEDPIPREFITAKPIELVVIRQFEVGPNSINKESLLLRGMPVLVPSPSRRFRLSDLKEIEFKKLQRMLHVQE